jgi:hypothetical protein
LAEPDKKLMAQNKDQLLREEEAQKRRIALRRQETEKRQREARRKRIVRNSYLAILWAGIIFGLFLGIAYAWPMIRKFILG